MTDPHVREVGRVADIDGCTTVIGVDYDTVTVHSFGIARSTRAQAEEFAQLFTAACWETARCGIEQELNEARRGLARIEPRYGIDLGNDPEPGDCAP